MADELLQRCSHALITNIVMHFKVKQLRERLTWSLNMKRSSSGKHVPVHHVQTLITLKKNHYL